MTKYEIIKKKNPDKHFINSSKSSRKLFSYLKQNALLVYSRKYRSKIPVYISSVRECNSLSVYSLADVVSRSSLMLTGILRLPWRRGFSLVKICIPCNVNATSILDCDQSQMCEFQKRSLAFLSLNAHNHSNEQPFLRLCLSVEMMMWSLQKCNVFLKKKSYPLAHNSSSNSVYMLLLLFFFLGGAIFVWMHPLSKIYIIINILIFYI